MHLWKASSIRSRTASETLHIVDRILRAPLMATCTSETSKSSRLRCGSFRSVFQRRPSRAALFSESTGMFGSIEGDQADKDQASPSSPQVEPQQPSRLIAMQLKKSWSADCRQARPISQNDSKLFDEYALSFCARREIYDVARSRVGLDQLGAAQTIT
jgi:hypothetical protein